MTGHFQSVGIIGAGSWGTALALLLHANHLPVTVWGHDPESISKLSAARENAAYLPGVRLPDAIRFTSELDDLAASDLLLIVTPSKAVREVGARLSTIGISPNAVLLSCTKGVERGSGLRMSQILAESCPGNPVAVLSGPSHAEEVAREMPTAITVGCADRAIAQQLQQAFSTRYFRAYTSDDVAGIEFGGAL